MRWRREFCCCFEDSSHDTETVEVERYPERSTFSAAVQIRQDNLYTTQTFGSCLLMQL